MNNKRLAVWVQGREVLPIRAIPYVTESPQFSPDSVARRFAECDPFGRKWTLEAYYLGNIEIPVHTRQWQDVVMRVESFESELRKQYFTDIAARAVWRSGAIAALPAGWFVYLDEFKKVFQIEMGDVIVFGGTPNEGKLSLSPAIDVDIRAMVMENFEKFPAYNPSTPLPCPHQDQPGALAKTEASPPVSAPKAERISENNAFLLDCEMKGIPMNIASIWLHIRGNAGKDNFLFKSASQNSATTVDGKSVTKKNLGRILGDRLNKNKTAK